MPLYNNHRYGRMEKSSINVLGMAMAILLVATTMTVFTGNQAFAYHGHRHGHNEPNIIINNSPSSSSSSDQTSQQQQQGGSSDSNSGSSSDSGSNSGSDSG